MKKSFKVAIFIFLLLAIDQITKIWVKTTMTLGESIHVFDWFQITFVENPGMAFGITVGSKIFLTIFRIIVSAGVLYYIIRLLKGSWRKGYIITVSMIFAGAVGNIIDSIFYGVIFSQSTPFTIATLMPQDGGYATLMQGKVVDMFFFPIFNIPQWMPIIGGEIFFSPVFNIADSLITVAIFILILFYRHDFNNSFEQIFYKKR